MTTSYADRFHRVFPNQPPIIGMVHLHSLPGSPNYGGNLADVIDKALTDARTLAEAGVDALLVENLHDYPYYPETIEPETVASVAVCARAVAEQHDLPMGINILRNSWKASLGIAAAVGAKFIRLNVLTDAMITDQGMINGAAHLAVRYRKEIGAQDVLILADLLSKHSAPIAPRPVPVMAADMLKRGGADGIIISGHDSSQPPSQERLQAIKEAIPDAPVILGSGMTAEHAPTYAKVADGAVFGWGAKPNADMLQPVSDRMATDFVKAWSSGHENREEMNSQR